MPADKDLLKVVAYPISIEWANIEQNLEMAEHVLSALPDDVDLFVLPELFSTGFIQDEQLLEAMAGRAEKQTLEAVSHWASKYNLAIAGSCLATKNGKYFNRGFFVEPSGKHTYYDKHHLFSLSAESEVYTRGDSLPPIVEYCGWNVSMVVCYDLRFPVWCRNNCQKYDILIVPANWATARGYAFHQLLIARAIENQAFVVGCNRGGSDDYGVYDDESYIFNPFGYEMAPNDTTATKGVVVEGQHNEGSKIGGTIELKGVKLLYAIFSKSQLLKTRTYLPAGRDADTFTIHINTD